MERIKAFLFDIDGTLVDTGGAGIRAMTRAFYEVLGLRDPFRGDSFTGRTDPEIFATAARRAIGREPTWEEEKAFFERYLVHLQEEVATSKGYKVLPGIWELLEALSERPHCIIGLCTGNILEGAKIKLERASLWNFFSFGGFGSDSPNRATLTGLAIERARALAKAEIDPLVIGDSPHDAYAARANGVRVALVCTGWTPPKVLEALRPDLFFYSFEDVETAISRLLDLGPSLRIGPSFLDKAVEVVQRGGVLIYPTSTVYGLGGNALDPEVALRVRRLKGGREAPFILLVSDHRSAWSLAAYVPKKAERLAKTFWPGSLTLVLPAHPSVPAHLLSQDGSIAVRVDGHPFARSLAEASGLPIISTSANRSGRPPPKKATEVPRTLILACDLFVEDEANLGGVPSTIVRCADDEVQVVREGAISQALIQKACFEDVG